MKYVLDTNILSALMRGDVGIIAKLRSVRVGEIGIPQPAFSEIAYGIQRLPLSRRRQLLEQRLEGVRTEFRGLLWDEGVSDAFGRIKATLEKNGQMLEDFDIAMAAHALALGAVLVSDNEKHMRRIKGLSVENWIARA